MVSPTNITNITPPRVPFLDERTGLVSRQWYRFFLNLFTLTGSGEQQPTLGITATAPLVATTGSTPNISVDGAALTAQDDTNVTLRLGGGYSDAVLSPTTISAGWNGVLSRTRGGTGPWDTSGGVLVSQGIDSVPAWSNTPTAFGYVAGAGSAVTQATSRTTGITINNPTGTITMFSAAGSPTPASFTVTNSRVGANDVVVMSVKSGATNNYSFNIKAVAAGSFTVTFWAQTGTAVDAPVINFVVLKGSAS